MVAGVLATRNRTVPGGATRSKRGAAAALGLILIIASACVPTVPPPEFRGPLGSIDLNLSQQHVYLYSPGGHLLARAPVSSGASGRTPTGTFRVTRKSRVGTSSGDHSVHMDYFTRFYGGIGFHGIPWKSSRNRRISTPLGIRPVSAGCVRMEDHVAEWIYNQLPVGAPVRVYY